jgi:hypothetical protein
MLLLSSTFSAILVFLSDNSLLVSQGDLQADYDLSAAKLSLRPLLSEIAINANCLL